MYVNGNNGNPITPPNFVTGVLIEGGSQSNTIGGTAQARPIPFPVIIS